MSYKPSKNPAVIRVDSAEEFINRAASGKRNRLIVWEGRTFSRSNLFLSSDGTRVHYTWRDKGGIKEGWESGDLPVNRCRCKIKSLMVY